MCTGEVTTDKLEEERDVENFIDYVDTYFQLTPSDEHKGVRELNEDFKKQTYNHKKTYHHDSFCMSIYEHSNGLASTIDFKCNRKIFQELPYVHTHKIPGGHYTNLLFQSKQLGLTDNCPEVKRRYTKSNVKLGYIPRVTPYSKVMGDLAQFIVSQDLSLESVSDRAEDLAFLESMIQCLRFDIGVSPGGFSEPLRSKVLKSCNLDPVEGHPGAE